MLIDELIALAERATRGPWEYETGPALNGRHHSVIDQEGVMVCECYEGTEEQQEANAKLIVSLVNNLPTILTALEALPVMREAISDACDLMQTAKGLADGPDGGSVTDHLDYAEHRLCQALASLPKETTNG
jgi:hypothetical protein